MSKLDYESDRFCPAYDKIVDCDLCYESIMVFTKAIKFSTVPETNEVNDIEIARKKRSKCPFSNLN